MADFNPDEFLAGTPSPETPQPQAQATQEPQEPQTQEPQETQEFNPEAFLADTPQQSIGESKYDTTKQQAIAGLEGVGQGIAGPLATAGELALGVKKEDILGRQQANPWTHGLGEAAGLGASMLTGFGEAKVLEGAGELAINAGKAANILKEGTSGFKVGSAVVKSAAEMAVLQSGDEISKALIDPTVTAEGMIANVGLGAALGGITGGVMAGVVSPLWKATFGKEAQTAWEGVQNQVNGDAVTQSAAATVDSLVTLGVEPDDVLKAGMSANTRAREAASTLVKNENPEMLRSVEKLKSSVQDSVEKSLPMSVKDVANSSNLEEGKNIINTFLKTDKELFGPIQEALEKRNAQASSFEVQPEAKADIKNKLLEAGLGENGFGAGSDEYKLYEAAAKRVDNVGTIGHLDDFKTEINGKIQKAIRAGDVNEINAYQKIKKIVAASQETQIRTWGNGELQTQLDQIIEQRMGANASYAKYADMQDELTNHLGIGSWKGRGALKAKLTEKLSPEQVLKKFSMKNNAEFADFLQKNYPPVFEEMRQNEARRFLKSAVVYDPVTNKPKLDIGKLNEAINSAQSGAPEYLNTVMPPETIAKARAGAQVLGSIPDPKNAAAATGLLKHVGNLPSSALAAVGAMVSHNPLTGAALAALGNQLGKFGPEATKLAYLKFLAKEGPVNSEAIKATTEMYSKAYNQTKLMSGAAKDLFRGGSMIAGSALLPDEKDREKLDKQVTKFSEDPSSFTQEQQKSQLGYYTPDHQAAVSGTMAAATQYCVSLQPKPTQVGPLDTPMKPDPSAVARYNRCLDIATQPAVIYKHIQDGTLQATDVQDLMKMYPSTYGQMQKYLMEEINDMQRKGERVPYRMQTALSLFMGQALDASHSPQSIVAAQTTFAPKLQPPQAGKKPNQKSGSEMEKDAKSHRTATQAAEADRGGRD